MMLIDRIHLNFNRTANYKARNRSYKSILFDDVQQVADFITGKKKDMEIAIPALKIQRAASLELQQRILSMSISERKKLGINKSTLWYQRKHLTEGKSIRLYNKLHAKLNR
jgi:CRISP-associated protein Cas1